MLEQNRGNLGRRRETALRHPAPRLRCMQESHVRLRYLLSLVLTAPELMQGMSPNLIPGWSRQPQPGLLISSLFPAQWVKAGSLPCIYIWHRVEIHFLLMPTQKAAGDWALAENWGSSAAEWRGSARCTLHWQQETSWGHPLGERPPHTSHYIAGKSLEISSSSSFISTVLRKWCFIISSLGSDRGLSRDQAGTAEGHSLT